MTDAGPPDPVTQFRIRRQKQVSWFDTRQLLATGSQALAASIIGSMSGRREIMAALDPDVNKDFEYIDRDEIWIDYIADTGDGWNATTSVAWLAGRDGIVLNEDGSATPQPIPPDCKTEGMPKAGEGQLVLPAGAILFLGGDEVYPTASPDTYQERFIDPFSCARWYQKPGRHLYSIPGNHDWYDGLTSFIRLFCQSEHARRWFGAWQAQQRRSYFAVRLPHRWWLWGIDMALEDDLDPPQYDYFRAQARKLKSGDKLILSVPAPTWLRHEKASAQSSTGRYIVADKLDIFMKLPSEVGRQVDIPLVLTGDLHYYAHHRVALNGSDRHYIVSGGGGAFGLGTLGVPETIAIKQRNGPALTGSLQKSFPDKEQSKVLRRGVFGFPLQNPAFSAALVGLQAITLWLLARAADYGWIDDLIRPDLDFGQLCSLMVVAAGHVISTPSLLLWVLVLLAGFGAFANGGKQPHRSALLAWAVGILHGLLQVLGTFVCVWLAAQLVGYLLTVGFDAEWEALAKRIGDNWATLLLAALISYFYCSLLFAAYLWLAHKTCRMHDQEVFSAQALEGYKGFLRMHIDAKGLTVYPIGLFRHVAEWRAAEGVTLETQSSGPFSKVQNVTVPPGCLRVVDPCEPLAPHLIEDPIFIPGAAAR